MVKVSVAAAPVIADVPASVIVPASTLVARVSTSSWPGARGCVVSVKGAAEKAVAAMSDVAPAGCVAGVAGLVTLPTAP